MILLLANTVFFILIYYTVPLLGFRYLPMVYLAGGAILAFWFVIYNRGFRTRGKTPDMLPESYTSTEREEMIADGERRFARSRWVLLVLLPILFTFLIDVLYLFFLPEGLFG